MAPGSLTVRDGAVGRVGRTSWGAGLSEGIARYVLMAIILALPLEFTAMFMGQPLARWLFVPAGVALLYLLTTRRLTVLIPPSPSSIALLVFITASLASWVLTRAPGSFRHVADIVMYPIAGLMFVNLARTEADHRRAWTALMVSGLGVAVVGAVLYITHSTIWTPNPAVAHRLNITFADPNITARFLTLCGVVAVIMFAGRKGPRWLAVAAALSCAVVIPMTWSRSGLALFIVSIALAVILSVDRRRAAALGACALVAFVLSTGLNPDTRQRANDAVQTLASTITGTAHNLSTPQTATSGQDTFALEDNRRYLIAAGIKMYTDHPLTGVGFGAYQNALITTYRRFLPPNVPNPDTVSHTAFMTTAAEQGALGTLLLLAFLITLAREAWRSRTVLWVVLPATLVVPIFLYSQFEGRFLEEPYLWVCVGLLYSAMLLERRRRVEELVPAVSKDRPHWRRRETA